MKWHFTSSLLLDGFVAFDQGTISPVCLLIWRTRETSFIANELTSNDCKVFRTIINFENCEVCRMDQALSDSLEA